MISKRTICINNYNVKCENMLEAAEDPKKFFDCIADHIERNWFIPRVKPEVILIFIDSSIYVYGELLKRN